MYTRFGVSYTHNPSTVICYNIQLENEWCVRFCMVAKCTMWYVFVTVWVSCSWRTNGLFRRTQSTAVVANGHYSVLVLVLSELRLMILYIHIHCIWEWRARTIGDFSASYLFVFFFSIFIPREKFCSVPFFWHAHQCMRNVNIYPCWVVLGWMV